MSNITAEEFFNALYNQTDFLMSFRAIQEPRPAEGHANSSGFLPGIFKDLKNSLIRMNNNSMGIFYYVNDTEGVGANDEDVKRSYAFFIDIDDDDVPEYFPVDPSAIISKGPKHHHIYWFIKDPLEDLEKWAAIQSILIGFYNSDKVIKNPARLMRVPGSLNHKDPQNKQKYVIVKDNFKARYTPEEITLAHTDPEKREKALDKRIKKLFPKKKLTDGEGRNKYMIQAVFALRDFGYTDKRVIREKLQKINVKYLADTYTEQELENIIEAQKYGKNDVGVSAVEKALREEARKKHVQEGINDWYYLAELNHYIDSKDPKRVFIEKTFNMMFAELSEKANTAMYAATNGLLNVAHGLKYEPGQGRFITEEGRTYINMYMPPDLEEKEGRPDWFLEHLHYIFNGDQLIIKHFLSYLAHMVQRPGDRINHAILISGHMGIGKSAFLAIFKKLFGNDNCHAPENEMLQEIYSDWAKNCQVCFIHELMQPDKTAFSMKLKSLITEGDIMVREMYKPSYQVSNHMQIIAMSNYDVPMRLEREDRRWFIVKSKAYKKPKEYYNELFSNIEENSGQILSYLKTYDISDFNAKDAPAITEAKEFLLEQSKNDFEVWLTQQITDKTGMFSKDFICVNDLMEGDEFPTRFKTSNRITYNYVLRLLLEMGNERIEQKVKINGSAKRIIVIRNHEKYLNAWYNEGKEKEVKQIIREQFEALAEEKNDFSEVLKFN